MSQSQDKMSEDKLPPLIENEQGNTRQMGIEIEFVGLTPEKVCYLLKDLFGGEIERVNDCEYFLKKSRLGEFRVELDARLLKNLAERSEKNIQNDVMFDIEGFLKRAVSTALEDIIPVEIVTPPLPISSCKELDKIVPALQNEGAKDTHASTLAAFGLHLNPEVPSLKNDSIKNYIQSYALLSDWLRREIAVDFTRVASTYIKEYPSAYRELILDNEYQPTMPDLIDDYLHYNPTRNRALDMLPLFSKIDPKRVSQKVESDLIKPRPTFHYRLANSNVSQPSWQFSTEWERWLMVEKLAHSNEMRTDMVDAFKGFMKTHWFSLSIQREKWTNITEDFIQTL